MSNFNIRINGTANMSQAKAEFAKLEAQVNLLNESINKSIVLKDKMGNPLEGAVNPAGYAKLQKAIALNSQVFRDAASSTGMFEVQQLRVNSATDEYTKALDKQKISFGQWREQQKLAKAAYKEQLSLQNMTVRKLPGMVGGKNVLDITFPKEVSQDLDTFGARLGWAREHLKSFSTEMINWGKNTQWAGRQLMVGFTVPVAMFAAAAGKAAYDWDAAMVRIQKVYNTTFSSTDGNIKHEIASQKELAQVREDAAATAMTAAKQYGAAAKDTLDVQGELAAIGYKGAQLQEMTNQVMRASVLGEIDTTTTMKSAVALMTTFGDSTHKLGDDFNYMNAIENATSLEMKDFAQAIPIAAKPVQMMGGDIKDLGTMLVAMKAGGIAAGEGANAIKAAFSRLANPAKTTLSLFKDLTGVDFHHIQDETQGKIIPMMKALGAAIEKLTPLEQRQVLSKLFGTQQVSRLSVLMAGLNGVGKGATQVHEAMQIAGQSTKAWADVADSEIKRVHDSASGTFKRSLHELQIEMATMGEPFLKIGASVVSGITSMVNAFNNMPSAFKNVAAGIAIGAAIIGPLVMFIGLMGNMVGNIGKVTAMLMRLGTRFKLVSADSKAAAIAASMNETEFSKNTTAVQELTSQLNLLTEAHKEAAKVSEIVDTSIEDNIKALEAEADAAEKSAAQWQSLIDKKIIAGGPGTVVDPRLEAAASQAGIDATIHRAMATNARGAEDARVAAAEADARRIAEEKATAEAEASRKTAVYTKAAAVSGSLFAGAMAASMFSSNKTVDSMANMVMAASVLTPTVMGMGKALIGIPWAELALTIRAKFWGALIMCNMAMSTFIAEVAAADGAVETLGVIFGGVKDAIMAMMGPIGWTIAGVAAMAAGFALLYRNAHKTGDAIKDMSSNAQPLGDMFGYTPSKTATVQTPEHSAYRAQEQVQTDAQKIGNAYPELIKQIQGARTEQEKFNEAMRVGLLVMDSGGSAADAQEATKAALTAAQKYTSAHKIWMDFKGRLDFNSNDLVRQAASWASNKDVQNAISRVNAKGFSERLLTNGATISDEAKNWLVDAGKKAAQAYNNGIASGKGTKPLLDLVSTQLDAIDNAISKSSGMQRTQLQNLRKEYITQVATANGTTDAVKGMTDAWFQNADALAVVGKTSAELTTKQRYDYLKKLQDEGKISIPQMGELLSLTVQLGNSASDTANRTGALADATHNLTDAQKAAAQAAMDLQTKMDAFNKVNASGSTTWVDTYKQAMTDAESTIGNQMSQDFSNRMNDAMNAYQAQQNGRVAKLENQQKNEQAAFTIRWRDRMHTVSVGYDDRIKKINAEIKAEQQAEQTRQNIFNAEKARLQYLADMANTNVDFNVAINTGNLDEAAKIRNDMQAKEADWALGNAQSTSAAVSAEKQKELQTEVNLLNKSKQARLNHLRDIKTAEQAALAERQKAAKAALDKEVKDNITAQQRIWDDRKTKMDQAIALFQAYIPINEADLRKHIADVGKQYGDFNTSATALFGSSASKISGLLADSVAVAASKVKSDIAWTTVGNDIARKLIKGALGMNLQQFTNWMISGVWPKQVKTPYEPKKHPAPGGTAAQDKVSQQLGHVFHTGGIVGVDRGGYAGIQPGHRDEVHATLLKGEGVLNRNAMSKLGQDGFRALNSGNSQYGTGGASDNAPLGLGGIMAAMLYRAVSQTIEQGIMNEATLALESVAGTYTPGKAGQYGNADISIAQMRNASIIANVGSGMGMSPRDIEIAIMTSLTESSLQNLHGGDRDSQGLFQQRPSQGWGTAAEITDPQYAATKFYQALQGVTDRASMPPWLAAQAVQRSAYADGSNYQPNWNEALAIFSGLGRHALTMGSGGRHRPVPRQYGLTQGLHDAWTGFPAVDFGVPIGTPVYAAADGRISRSYDLRGYEPRNAVQDGYRSYGRVMQVDHGGFSTLYAHLSDRFGSVGQKVLGGTQIGQSGNTGNSTGPHLHFGAQGVSPMDFVQLNKGAMDIKWDNTIANLHHGEAVLTKDINDDFKRGVKNFADGGKTEYNLHMHVNGEVNVDELVGKTVTAIQRLESRKPQSRNYE